MGRSGDIRPIRTLAVANRGEIAARILRTCRSAGIRSAALYSEADRHAPYLALADRIELLGPAPALESYLNPERVIDAAVRAGADAIHPGYGFLSENAEFAALCEERGIVFVGPPAAVIRALGDKAAAKATAIRARVPVVQGYFGEDQSDERLLVEGSRIGAPLMIKASAGGGGRGMRVVRDLAEFPLLLREARRESAAAFGNSNVLLERYVQRPRHIEFQIFGDTQGRVVSLNERECSLQRRHQKILEESPCCALTAPLRAKMAEAAIAIGRAAGYVGAGTVEFLLERSGDASAFYFLEVNTRLQVEHPVTEMRTGLDLVRMQIDVAEGRALPASVGRSPSIGHSIEVRICAEDPSRQFAPSLGTLAHWVEPAGPGVRVDSGVARGSEVTPYYDPMLAKLIVHAATRERAISRLETALKEFGVLGVAVNIPYLASIVDDAEFRAGNTHIQFLEERFCDWRPETTVPKEVLLALAAATLSRITERPRTNASNGTTQPTAPLWERFGPWRNS